MIWKGIAMSLYTTKSRTSEKPDLPREACGQLNEGLGLPHQATLAHLNAHSVADILHYRADTQPSAIAFIHLLDGERNEQAISYRELWQRAQTLAHALAPFAPEGKRVLMLFETGIDYITALFGIFLAGGTAIPSFPPIGSRALNRLAIIATDAEPDLVLTNQRFSQMRDRVMAALPSEQSAPSWIDMDCLTTEQTSVAEFPPLLPEHVALLQYTSGSTSDPKGVMLTHANLLSNCHSASVWMGGKRTRMGCSWLPPYHDMGLMGGILQPIYEGFPTVLISPSYFVQRPWRWLDAVSRFRVTVTIAPNFAFDLCIESITDEEKGLLDLSSIEEIYCGAEPVRQSTLDRFAEHFASTGFKARSFSPCYGLAEATVFVTGKPVDSPPITFNTDKDELAQGRLKLVAPENPAALPLVSSGRAAPGNRVVIVDPQKHREIEDGQIGEIWVQGGNVGVGYWGKPEDSIANFHAQLPAISGRFMRTGDLGATLDGELYVTGRIKDLIIIAGRNLYPHDLELCIQNVDPRLRANGVVAVGVDNEQEEWLAVIAEIKRRAKLSALELEELRQHITAALVSEFGVSPKLIHFGPVGTIPITTSGKARRQSTKLSLVKGTLACYTPLEQ
jgi:acyl-CoA synthetase (AMP-forming)/AMP-acid ligase II